jgi:hypothetical protein
MARSDDDEQEFTSEDDAAFDDEVQSEAEVSCPYCGESVSIELDVAGGASQEYVQDCSVCCQPWRVQVEYDDAGVAQVTVEESQ